MADTGLLTSMALADKDTTQNSVYRAALMGNVGLNEGMLIGNVVAQSLVANGKKLFFCSQSGKRCANTESAPRKRLEIDFLMHAPYKNAADKPRISPIEVKSQRQFGTLSLDRL